MPDPKPPPRRRDRFSYTDDDVASIEIHRATDEEHVAQKKATAQAEANTEQKPPS